MKKIFYFLTIFAALVLAACEEIVPDELPDDGGTINPPTSYVNNKIYYTSDDEQVIQPTRVNFGEGVEIVSNVYEDGQGIITFNQDVTEIGDGSFNSCTRLTSITLPNGITEIGEYVFVRCPLTNITIPDSVTRIGSGAFNACGIEYITIPGSVTEIGWYAFAMCYRLASVYCEAVNPPVLCSGAFNDNASGRKIYVPHKSVEAYKTAEGWKEYADDIEGYDFQ